MLGLLPSYSVRTGGESRKTVIIKATNRYFQATSQLPIQERLSTRCQHHWQGLDIKWVCNLRWQWSQLVSKHGGCWTQSAHLVTAVWNLPVQTFSWWAPRRLCWRRRLEEGSSEPRWSPGTSITCLRGPPHTRSSRSPGTSCISSQHRTRGTT